MKLGALISLFFSIGAALAIAAICATRALSRRRETKAGGPYFIAEFEQT